MLNQKGLSKGMIYLHCKVGSKMNEFFTVQTGSNGPGIPEK